MSISFEAVDLSVDLSLDVVIIGESHLSEGT